MRLSTLPVQFSIRRRDVDKLSLAVRLGAYSRAEHERSRHRGYMLQFVHREQYDALRRRETHIARRAFMKVVLGWNNASAFLRHGRTSHQGVFAEIVFWNGPAGQTFQRQPCNLAIDLPRADLLPHSESHAFSRVPLLGSMLRAPPDPRAFLATASRYGPDWLLCPSWAKALGQAFIDDTCGVRCPRPPPPRSHRGRTSMHDATHA